MLAAGRCRCGSGTLEEYLIIHTHNPWLMQDSDWDSPGVTKAAWQALPGLGLQVNAGGSWTRPPHSFSPGPIHLAAGRCWGERGPVRGEQRDPCLVSDTDRSR